MILGKYQNETNQDECKECPGYPIIGTDILGSKDIADCGKYEKYHLQFFSYFI